MERVSRILVETQCVVAGEQAVLRRTLLQRLCGIKSLHALIRACIGVNPLCHHSQEKRYG